LPFVFRPDADGNVNMMDTVKKGVGLVQAAEHLLRGGFTIEKVKDAKMLLGGATDFFNSLHHRRSSEVDGQGLESEHFSEHWENENKDVWMFSGCADDQTSADTAIAGSATGAMSWAFIGTMRENPNQSYLNVSYMMNLPPLLKRMTRLTMLMMEQILQNTRQSLVQNYSQIPQLSCGGHYNLDQPLAVSYYRTSLL
jgi:hypothetical protein